MSLPPTLTHRPHWILLWCPLGDLKSEIKGTDLWNIWSIVAVEKSWTISTVVLKNNVGSVFEVLLNPPTWEKIKISHCTWLPQPFPTATASWEELLQDAASLTAMSWRCTGRRFGDLGNVHQNKEKAFELEALVYSGSAACPCNTHPFGYASTAAS